MLLSAKNRYFAMISRPAGDQQREHDHRDPLRRDHRFLLGLGRVARRRRNGGRRTNSRGRSVGCVPFGVTRPPPDFRFGGAIGHRAYVIAERIEERCRQSGAAILSPVARVLVIDSYDSFVYNLVQYLGELGADPVVVRNDALTVDEAVALQPDLVLLSPGPGPTRDERHHLRRHRRVRGDRHTAARGVPRPPGDRSRLRRVRRRRSRTDARQDVGRSSTPARACSRGIESPITATRYHSLTLDPPTIPDALSSPPARPTAS